MKYIQSRITYALTGVFALITIAVGCSDVMKTNNFESVGTEELIQNSEFKSVVSDIEKINAPLVKKMESMQIEEIKEFRKEISSYIDRSGSDPKLTIDARELLHKMGYENVQQYKERWQSIRNKVEKLHSTYPEFKKGAVKEATFRILKKNNPKYSNTTVLDDPCVEEFDDCLRDATVQFSGGTAMCVVVGTFGSFVSGLACQAVNIGIYETQKYVCAQDYWECTGCNNHCMPPKYEPEE